MRKKIIIIISVIIVLILGRMIIDNVSKSSAANKKKMMGIPTVTVDTVKSAQVRREFDAPARVMAKYRVEVLARINGYLTKSYFKEGEGAWADGMVALRGTGHLRLYGIYFHDAVILLGSGGYKPPEIAAYEDYPPLNAKAQQMKAIAKEIYTMIVAKELKLNEDGTLDVF